MTALAISYPRLDVYAKARNPRVRAWYSAKSTSSRRTYRCNVCGETIDTESARWPMTDHAFEAIKAHVEEHHGLDQLLGELGVLPVPTSTLKKTYGTIDQNTMIPGRKIDGIWCVNYGVYIVLMHTSPKKARRAVLDRAVEDPDFADALEAAAAVPNGVSALLRQQGFEVNDA